MAICQHDIDNVRLLIAIHDIKRVKNGFLMMNAGHKRLCPIYTVVRI